MNSSFHIVATTMAIMMVAGVAMAGSVDIGLGRMDQSEFDTLKQMVSGDYQPPASIATERPREVRVAEFNWADVQAIRQVMVARAVEQNHKLVLTNKSTVDIGTGSMSTSEFCDLNKLVANNSANQIAGFTFICP
ncbi:hypothetical protein DSCW_48520 [Desulfosarcina widdelii]|uniref:Uncharacterized protein n=1 Tax=Desulfosarcina widdelii TaxID=947919 RepID=A0A5K7Z9P4_9BACT|nr:hypothetical protein [Desulfosarcina widdelii]BBO77435.1 hypothetical protein DSCW_48520 [Desulfosarcina widdelii]